MEGGSCGKPSFCKVFTLKGSVSYCNSYKVKSYFFAWNLCEYDIKLFKNVASTKSLVYYKLVST